MKAWFDSIKSTIPAGSKLVVTGYSLGGHLATAFDLLYPNVATESYTFNGAGVGVMKDGYSLAQVVSEFAAHRFDNADLFATQAGKDKYNLLRATFHEGASFTSVDVGNGLAVAQALANTSIGPAYTAAQMMVDALDRILSVVKEVERVNAGIASGSTDSAPAAPVPVSEVAAASLDYQLAFLRATLHAAAERPMFDGLGLVAYMGREIAPNPIPTLTDVYGDTPPSGVANSQIHHGTPAPVFIEDQPLWRGNVGSGIIAASTWGKLWPDVKLLLQGFALNDFGDTHSLVLLVDSLSVQQVLAKLDPSATPARLARILQASSHLAASGGDASQGKAEGDVLEKVVTVLGTMLGLDSSEGWIPLNGNPNGGTWARLDEKGGSFTGRNPLHANLKLIADDADFHALAGKVTVEPVTDAMSSLARNDFGAFLALASLSPFYLKATGDAGQSALASLGQGAWAEQYQQWIEDIASRNVGAEASNFTDSWYSDRGAMLKWLVALNLNNYDLENTGGKYYRQAITQNAAFTDLYAGESFTVVREGPAGGIATPVKVVFGTDGDDGSVTGGAESDHLFGGGGDDVVSGLAGADYLEGNPGADTLRGGAGVDTLVGGRGDDVLDGGPGIDALDGGTGTDTYILRASDAGADTITDGDGLGIVKVVDTNDVEVARIGGSTFIKDTATRWHSQDNLFTVTASAQTNGKLTLNITGAGVTVNVKDFTNGNLGITLPDSPKPLPQPIADLTIEGDITDNQLADGPGNDLVIGWGGNDNLNLMSGGNNWGQGSSGNDYLYAGGGNDTLEGGLGRDIVVGNGGDDLLWGREREPLADILAQTVAALDSEADLVTATGGNDTVLGWAGNDALMGGSGRDLIAGGAGDDNIFGDRVAGAPATAGVPDWSVTRQVTTDAQGNVTSRTLDFGTLAMADGDAPDGDIIFAGYGADWVFGEGGNDYIDAGEGNDLAIGGAGNDMLLGAGGDDELQGDGDTGNTASMFYVDPAQHGNDYLYGGLGNDKLMGGGRDDELHGGDGNDTLFGDANGLAGQYHGNDYLYGDDGDDILVGGGGQDDLFGGNGNDQLEGDAELIAGNFHGADRLFGGAGKDTLLGSGGSDLLAGEDGDDLVYGDNPRLSGEYHGDDNIDGGAGNDVLVGQGGNDTVQGGDGADKLYGDSEVAAQYEGADLLDGGAGNDTLSGGGGNDTLIGGAGDDQLSGDAGDDVLEGGAGADLLAGGAGNDTYVFNAGDTPHAAAEVIDDTQGANRIVLKGMGGIENLSLVQLDPQTQFISNGVDTVIIKGGLMSGSFASVEVSGKTYTAAQFFGKTYTSAVNSTATTASASLQGGAQGDTLTLTGGASTVAGGAGNDVLTGSGNNNVYVFNAGDGTDTISDSGTGNHLKLGEGITADTVKLAHANGALVVSMGDAAAGSVKINGFNPANATAPGSFTAVDLADGTSLTWQQLLARGFDLTGTTGNDTITGTSTTDRITGGTGNDSMSGGAGDDIYYVNLGDGTDTLADNDPTLGTGDTLAFGFDVNPYLVTARQSGNDAILKLGATDQVVLKDFMTGGANAIEKFTFADGTEWSHADVVAILEPMATAGNDTVVGGDADELLPGLAGNDTIYAGRGNDTLQGGTGTDLLVGGPGNDTYDYKRGDGADTVNDLDATLGGGGFDTLLLGGGITAAGTTLQRSGNDLIVNTGVAGDTINILGYYSRGDFEAIAFAGGPTWKQPDIAAKLPMLGTALGDTIMGTAAADSIDGGAGADSLFGAGGDDVLRGGTDTARQIAYKDYLDGGDGNDVLYSGTAPATLVGGAGNDILIGTSTFIGDGGANLMFGTAGAESFFLQPDTNNIVVGGKGEDSVSTPTYTSTPKPPPTGRNLFLYNTGDGADAKGSSPGNAAANDILSPGQTPYSTLTLGGVGTIDIGLKVGRTLLSLSQTRVGDTLNNLVQYLQVVVAPADYSATSTDPLKNHKVVVIDWTGLAQEASTAKATGFDVLATMRKHIAWSSDTLAYGGKIAWEYAKVGNIDAVTQQQRFDILADPGLNIVGQPVTVP
ncbi:beta strand repeat-containing protein [Ramlibacter albus]|uniref:Haemolysin-type calcium binding-related domain-containing protein n=1 Tax=Ramlibacter albus TaxID=2079448 RepID=A0A923MAL6_9BURK|nr:calcium-binding protein [Ramlibacter albus]MBC5767322.1 hypothetical protein [Ramlibacter albus]